MKKSMILLLAIILMSTSLVAQVSINTDGSDPDGSAMLDIKSTDKGILIPRVTLNDASTAAPVANPVEGLIIYNIDGSEAKGFYYWTGTEWQIVGGGTAGCEVYGNPSIEALSNGIATTVSVCQGQSLSLTSTDNGNWDSSTPAYSWTGPNSYSSTLSDPGEVTASFDASTHAGDYTVTISNGIATGCSYSSTVTVTESPSTPSTPGTITGNTSICENSTGEAYSIDAVASATSYTWIVPSGATVTSGQGTTSITVDFGSSSGNVSVRAENECGNSTYNDLTVSVNFSPSITTQPEDLTLTGTSGGNFTLTASDATSYQWQENQGSGFSDVTDGGVYSGATTSTLSISDGTGMDGYQYQCLLTNACGNTTSNTVVLNWVIEVYNSTTGEYWMDRNLGASQQATSSDDYLAYGSLYQWGRASEGHEVINWTSSTGSDGAEQGNETSTTATTAVPDEGNGWDGKFITVNTSPYDWLTPQDDNLWQGISGTNNPCPAGYRLPTNTELDAERQSWGSSNSAGAYNSPLKLTTTGIRNNSNGSISYAGSRGHYWSSTINGTDTGALYFGSSNTFMFNTYRAYGFSVRCIKD